MKAFATQFGPQPFTDPTPPQFYECCCCGHYHPANWLGDCRDDNNRFSADQLDEKYGTDNWEEVYLDNEPCEEMTFKVTISGPDAEALWHTYRNLIDAAINISNSTIDAEIMVYEPEDGPPEPSET